MSSSTWKLRRGLVCGRVADDKCMMRKGRMFFQSKQKDKEKQGEYKRIPSDPNRNRIRQHDSPLLERSSGILDDLKKR